MPEWQDLHRLTQDEDTFVRLKAVHALGKVFSQVLDKTQAWQAWQDLHRLTQDKESYVREGAADALGKAFSQVPDKTQAWQDLDRLTQDEDTFVRWSAADALGKAFSQVPDKTQAWQDLDRLTQDEDSGVRRYAYHSLGRASVFKATEANDNAELLRNKLEDAVSYFEKSSQEQSTFFNPARFCYLFYRTYFAITFKEAKEEEVQRYLADAKKTVGDSKSKEDLLKAVENLAIALKESQRLRKRPIQEIAGELSAYRWYCEKASEYMAAAENKAPGAVKLMRICNPLLEERIQTIIADIQRAAKKTCQVTRGSGKEYEVSGSQIHIAAGDLSSNNLVSVQASISIIVKELRKFCQLLPDDEKETVCKVVKEIEHTPAFPEKLLNIALALSNLNPVLQKLQPSLADIAILTVLPEEYRAVYNQITDFIPLPDMGSKTNLFAWQFSNVHCSKYNGNYKVAIGMIGRAGTNQSALAVREAIDLWRPRYIFFIGIAGGLADLRKGDVVIADVIYGYEYGKISSEKFELRGNWTFKTDQALLTGANAYALRSDWRNRINAMPPEECKPDIVSGEIASGEKVVDDPTNEFFIQVLGRYPKVKAVEMEGAGVGSAIEQAQSRGKSVGFMMVRGISDLPRPEDKGKDTKERDDWKPYASGMAAAFTIGWIADGLPIRPSTQ